MSITKKSSGFDSLVMEADNGAELHARIEQSGEFFVGTDEGHLSEDVSTGWFFDEDACREEAKFFIEIPDEIKRRGGE